MSQRPIIITTDTHIAGAHVDFGPYFDPKYRPIYDEQRELTRRAAAVVAKRKAASNAKTGTASASLLDGFAMGDSPFEPELILESQRRRQSLLQDMGIDEWDDDEFMSVPREDDPSWRLKMLELDGTAGSVVFPQLGFILGVVEDPDVKWAGIRAHNRWLADFCSNDPERWAGVFMVDLADIDRCCEEAVWARDNGLRGGSFIQGGSPPNLPTFNQLYYERYFSTLEELALPFNMHAAFKLSEGGWRTGPGAAFLNQMWTNSEPLNKGGPLYYWLGGGVFERHPNLKVVVAETGGLFWVPEVLRTLDEMYEATERSAAMRVLSRSRLTRLREFPRKPSEYFASNVYVQGHSWPIDWEALPDVGFDNVMWGSDFPHAEGSWPDSPELLRDRQSEFRYRREDLDKYLSKNAAAVYGFDLDALQSVADRIAPDLDEFALRG